MSGRLWADFYNNTAPGRFIVKNRYYLMAFILPLLILTAAYIALGVYPFGERQVQIIDSYHQYAPFFFGALPQDMGRRVAVLQLCRWSWNEFLGDHCLLSGKPFKYFSAFVPPGFLLEAFTFLIMLKIALASTAFAYYIRRRFRRYDVTIVYFALFYALCGWVLGYNWNVMWLDCLVLLPLIILGLERLVKKRKGTDVRPDTGAVYYMQLLYCDHGLSVSYTLFFCTVF